MRESDLRTALDQIVPDEALIRATIEKVERQKYKMAAEAAARMCADTPARSFYPTVSRIAGALCALLLVVGMGISMGKDLTPSALPDAANYSRSQFNDVAAQDAALPADLGSSNAAHSPAASGYNEDARTAMLARAEALNTDYIVIDAVMTSCYILPADADGSHGCMLSFDQANVITASEGAASLLKSAQAGAVTVPLAQIRCSTEQEQLAVIDAMGSRMCVLIYADGDTLRIDPDYLLAE